MSHHIILLINYIGSARAPCVQADLSSFIPRLFKFLQWRCRYITCRLCNITCHLCNIFIQCQRNLLKILKCQRNSLKILECQKNSLKILECQKKFIENPQMSNKFIENLLFDLRKQLGTIGSKYTYLDFHGMRLKKTSEIVVTSNTIQQHADVLVYMHSR